MKFLRKAKGFSRGAAASAGIIQQHPVPVAVSRRSLHHTSRLLSYPQPEQLFRGVQGASFVGSAEFRRQNEDIPIFRMMDHNGSLAEGTVLPFSLDVARDMYKTMLKVSVADRIFYDIQRQGRISFYMQNNGEEAAQVGSAAALELDDVLYLQYRELGVLFWRGFTVEDMAAQCFSVAGDEGKGRQMPVHYSKRGLNVTAISSPLATQIPHACGSGYAMRVDNKQACAVAYFGEGAASEGDFMPAINFAATLKSQTLFICRNNGFAISTPVEEQYSGDGIAARSIAFGMDSIRVDGNDLVAVYVATREARKRCIERKESIMLELMTYRVGHHSTSDDSSHYREDAECNSWREEGMSAIGRFKRFIISKNAWDQDLEAKALQEFRREIMATIKDTEKKNKFPLDELFTDVYDKPNWRLQEQEQELKCHLDTYASHYDLSRFQSSQRFPHPKTQGSS